jgi:hypothetical protein
MPESHRFVESLQAAQVVPLRQKLVLEHSEPSEQVCVAQKLDTQYIPRSVQSLSLLHGSGTENSMASVKYGSEEVYQLPFAFIVRVNV